MVQKNLPIYFQENYFFSNNLFNFGFWYTKFSKYGFGFRFFGPILDVVPKNAYMISKIIDLSDITSFKVSISQPSFDNLMGQNSKLDQLMKNNNVSYIFY